MAHGTESQGAESRRSRRRFLTTMGAASSALLLMGKSEPRCEPVPLDAASDAGGDGEPPPELCEVTGGDVEGPFHVADAPFRTQLAAEDEPGERLRIEGVVYDADCATPLAGALLDIWHADAEGAYHDDRQTYRLRGQLISDDDGRFAFETIRPGRYPMAGSMRPAHIHFMVSSPGYVSLTTQLYFAGDPYLAPNDPCTTCSSDDDTLIIPLERSGGVWRGRFEIILAPSAA